MPTKPSSPNIDLDQYPVAENTSPIKEIPVIDITGLIHGQSNHPANQEIISEIASACENWGFFQIINHGIGDLKIAEIFRLTSNFFASEQPHKDALLRSYENPWGYYNNELTKNQRDKKEVFDFTNEGIDPIYQGSNRWPSHLLGFKTSMMEYFNACSALSLKLMEAMCVALGLPPTQLHSHVEGNHTGFIRLNYYPVSDPLENSSIPHLPVADRGVHHHTDAGILTLLLQDQTGGLQVFKDDVWYPVASIPGAIVVNTGDLMQVWSNNHFQAAMHRVVAMEKKDRYSVPFFYNPSAQSVIKPLKSKFCEPDAEKYHPISWQEFRTGRTAGDYADYGTEIQIAHFRK